MKKKWIVLGALLIANGGFAQVGIGTLKPHKSAILHLEVMDGKSQGLLIPRVALKGSKDSSIINNGDIAESLLVYNTTNATDLSAGFYYWTGKQWDRIISKVDFDANKDLIPKNKKLAVDQVKEKLYLEDSNQHTVSVALSDINIVTSIIDNKDGTYTYTNEAGVTQTIDISGSVINNITTILQDETVINEIYNNVAAKGKELKTADSSILVEGGLKAVLNETKISVANKGITTAKLSPGGNKQLLITDATGQVKWVSASDEVIKEAIKLNVNRQQKVDN